MIIKDKKSTVFGSDISSSTFKIKNSPKAFQILSSNLYSNKIRAIIREYSCNALDAHRYAKKENEPFKVQLPTKLSPVFSVRDFGNGLSPEEIKELFTTYFSSSKDNSNDFTGALGLGSKSAFSYTDTFSCISYYNGQKYIYSLFLDGGEPKVSLMHQEKSNEQSGVEIIVPVKEDDIYSFEYEAEYVFSSFDVKPTGLNNIVFKPCIELKDNLKIIKTINCVSERCLYARMGNVLYPIQNPSIDYRGIIGYLDFFGINNRNNFFVLDFDIGKSIEEFSLGLFKYESGNLYFAGEALHGVLIDKIINSLKNGESDVNKYIHFIEHCMDNQQNSIDEMWSFLKHNDIEINEDGLIIGYKKVSSKDSNLIDSYTKTVINNLGTVVRMPRTFVNPNKNETCSHGLHVGSMDYVKSFSGDTIVRVLVNPADVVSVPSDYNGQKMRCSEYFVDAIVDSNFSEILKADAFTGISVVNKSGLVEYIEQ